MSMFAKILCRRDHNQGPNKIALSDCLVAVTNNASNYTFAPEEIKNIGKLVQKCHFRTEKKRAHLLLKIALYLEEIRVSQKAYRVSLIYLPAKKHHFWHRWRNMPNRIIINIDPA